MIEMVVTLRILLFLAVLAAPAIHGHVTVKRKPYPRPVQIRGGLAGSGPILQRSRVPVMLHGKMKKYRGRSIVPPTHPVRISTGLLGNGRMKKSYQKHKISPAFLRQMRTRAAILGLSRRRTEVQRMRKISGILAHNRRVNQLKNAAINHMKQRMIQSRLNKQRLQIRRGSVGLLGSRVNNRFGGSAHILRNIATQKRYNQKQPVNQINTVNTGLLGASINQGVLPQITNRDVASFGISRDFDDFNEDDIVDDEIDDVIDRVDDDLFDDIEELFNEIGDDGILDDDDVDIGLDRDQDGVLDDLDDFDDDVRFLNNRRNVNNGFVGVQTLGLNRRNGIRQGGAFGTAHNLNKVDKNGQVNLGILGVSGVHSNSNPLGSMGILGGLGPRRVIEVGGNPIKQGHSKGVQGIVGVTGQGRGENHLIQANGQAIQVLGVNPNQEPISHIQHKAKSFTEQVGIQRPHGLGPDAFAVLGIDERTLNLPSAGNVANGQAGIGGVNVLPPPPIPLTENTKQTKAITQGVLGKSVLRPEPNSVTENNGHGRSTVSAGVQGRPFPSIGRHHQGGLTRNELIRNTIQSDFDGLNDLDFGFDSFSEDLISGMLDTVNKK